MVENKSKDFIEKATNKNRFYEGKKQLMCSLWLSHYIETRCQHHPEKKEAYLPTVMKQVFKSFLILLFYYLRIDIIIYCIIFSLLILITLILI